MFIIIFNNSRPIAAVQLTQPKPIFQFWRIYANTIYKIVCKYFQIKNCFAN